MHLLVTSWSHFVSSSHIPPYKSAHCSVCILHWQELSRHMLYAAINFLACPAQVQAAHVSWKPALNNHTFKLLCKSGAPLDFLCYLSDGAAFSIIRTHCWLLHSLPSCPFCLPLSQITLSLFPAPWCCTQCSDMRRWSSNIICRTRIKSKLALRASSNTPTLPSLV